MEAESSWEIPHYGRILAAVDGSPESRFALRHAVAGSLRQHSRLTLLSVVPPPPRALAGAGVSPQQLAAEAEARVVADLRETVESLPRDLSVTFRIRHGDPAEEILAELREEQFDLLCMGARGRGRMASALLGSVSAFVLSRSPVPVVVWHPAAP